MRKPGAPLVCALLLLGLGLAHPGRATEPSEASEPTPEAESGKDFDPWQGIDRNGRIPKVPIPPVIENPERWRYIPEGHLKPGNVIQRLLVSSLIIPYVYRSGDVGTGFGLAVTDIDFRLQRRREYLGAFASYTTRKQQDYVLSWRRWLHSIDLEGGGVLQEERSFVRAKAGYRKTLTRRFFGFGPDSLEEDESSYTDEVFFLGLGSALALPVPFDDVVFDLDLTSEFHQLDDGTVEDRPSMRDSFPAIFAADETANLGVLSLGLRWDTRDSQSNPYGGWHAGAVVDTAFAQTGGEVGAVFTFSAGHVILVPGLFHDGGDAGESHPPTDVIALGVSSQATAGYLPFFWQPNLGGGQTQRGYIDGRWRDRAAWHGSAEYRFWVIPRGFPVTRNVRIERVGLAAFYELGSVAGDWPALAHARLAHSYGAGLRISLERVTIFRIDLGYSDEGHNVTIGFGLSF